MWGGGGGEHQSKGIIEKGIKKKEFKGTLSKGIDRGGGGGIKRKNLREHFLKE